MASTNILIGLMYLFSLSDHCKCFLSYPIEYWQTVTPSPDWPLPFEETYWKQSTSSALLRCTFQQKTACPLPLIQLMPTRSPRRILLSSTATPRLWITTDPAESLIHFQSLTRLG